MTAVLKKGVSGFIFYQQKSRAKQYQWIFGFLLILPYSNTTTHTLMLFQRIIFLHSNQKSKQNVDQGFNALFPPMHLLIGKVRKIIGYTQSFCSGVLNLMSQTIFSWDW